MSLLNRSKLKKTAALLSMACLTLLLTACGFHLRQSVALPDSLHATMVQGASEYSELDLSLKRAFRQAGYPLTTAGDASAVLQITTNEFTRRVLSVNSSGVANEYELKYTLQFKLLDTENKQLVPQQAITIYRSYRYDPDNVLAKSAEEKRLQKDMTEHAVKQLIRRLAAKRPVPVNSNTAPARSD